MEAPTKKQRTELADNPTGETPLSSSPAPPVPKDDTIPKGSEGLEKDEKHKEAFVDHPLFPPLSSPHVWVWVTSHGCTIRFCVETSMLMAMQSQVINVWLEDPHAEVHVDDFGVTVYETLFRLFLRPFCDHQQTLESVCNHPDLILAHDVLKLAFKLDVPKVLSQLGTRLASTRTRHLKSLTEALIDCKLQNDANALVRRWIKLCLIPKDMGESRPFLFNNGCQPKSARLVKAPYSASHLIEWGTPKEMGRGAVALDNDSQTKCKSVSGSGIYLAIRLWLREGRNNLVRLAMDSLLDTMASDKFYILLEPEHCDSQSPFLAEEV